MTAQLDVEEIRRVLATRDVLAFYQWPTKKSGHDLESRACPRRLDHSRRALVITPKNGRWFCHACGYGGDLLTFVAEMEQLSLDSDFPAVLTKAAEICGVTPSTMSDEERTARREQWRREREEMEQKEREEKRAREAAAIPIATARWSALLAKHPRGAEYLCERRVAAVAAHGVVRFDPDHAGSPSLALYTRGGEIRNVVTRRVPELAVLDGKKAVGLYECPAAGTLINSVSQIEQGRDVVFVEGVMDALTARIAWPDAIILGAHGAGNLPKIARVAMPVIAIAKARLLIVPHQDERGFAVALEAATLAVEAGLSIRRGSLVVVKTDEKDLNDAWRHGWRPAA